MKIGAIKQHKKAINPVEGQKEKKKVRKGKSVEEETIKNQCQKTEVIALSEIPERMSEAGGS